MDNDTAVGANRTGTMMAPLGAGEMQALADRQPAAGDPATGERRIADFHRQYIQEAERVGSVPIPTTVKGVVTGGLGKLMGRSPEVLIDKIGERLAFERSGARLYQAFADKVACGGEDAAHVPIGEVMRIREQELAHLRTLRAALESLGADATAQTPCADVTGVAASGILQVLSDPRTTIAQCLNALLIAELADEAGWMLLIDLAASTGQHDLVTDFRVCSAQEEEHVECVREWLRQAVVGEGTRAG